jgi:hypothetical protein
MPDFDKLPTDRLYKFLSILGLVIVVLSVVLPLGALWQVQLQQNQVEGEQRKYALRRDGLKAEIDALQAQGRWFSQRIKEAKGRLGAIARKMREDAVGGLRKGELLDIQQLKRVGQFQGQVLRLMTELQALEKAPQRDQEAIRQKDKEIDRAFLRLAEGMPNDVAEAAKTVVRACRLEKELNRLKGEDRPDPKAVKKKEAELAAAFRSARQQMKALVEVRQERSSRRRASLLEQLMEGLMEALISHQDLLRLLGLARQSGEHLASKVRELKIAEVDLHTKKKEVEIVRAQVVTAFAAGALGLTAGLVVMALGFWWWYRADRVAERKEEAEARAAEAAVTEPRTPPEPAIPENRPPANSLPGPQ